MKEEQHQKKPPEKPADRSRAWGDWQGWPVFLLTGLIVMAAIGMYYFATAYATRLVKQEIAAVQQAWQPVAAELKKMEQQLSHQNAAIETLLQERPYLQQSWLLHEVHYYLQLANADLLWQGDVASALVLLRLAQSRLSEPTEHAFLGLQHDLEAFINKLSALPRVDKAGINHQLTTLAKQIVNLPLRYQVADHSQQEEQAPVEWWNRWRQWVVVRHDDDPVAVMLTPDQEVLLQQAFYWQLAQAKLALVQRDADTYLSSLKQAEDWLKKYFDRHADIAKNVLTDLETLQKVDIAPTLPTLSGLLKQLQSLLTEQTAAGEMR